ncbi:hypothetical protein FIBSPDRAFT_948310 [Athelia psychrophila]|uniref:DDE-1 domain-containing protein n=1 Tax=Athelia psychrophila TaxID=1759441 RepID=A0A166QZD8_9AGAM|nr:hypothetical protein FIBSPDRAFT_948310 [Fibularhizoctonia sp. CBS 109695]
MFHMPQNRWTNGELAAKWIVKDFDRQTKDKAAGKTQVLLMDDHSSHYTPELLSFAKANNIIILGYPPHCTHALQGLDVVCFVVMKQAWKEEINAFEAPHRSKIGKEHFTEVFGKAYLKAFTVPTILSAFEKTGIHPFNPEVITAQQMKPSLPSSLIGSLPLPMPSPVRKIMEVFNHKVLTTLNIAPGNYQPPLPSLSNTIPSTPSTSQSIFPSISTPAPFTPLNHMRILGAALASTKTGAFLVQKPQITSAQTISNPVYMQPEIIPDPDWSLLLALAKLQIASKDKALITGNAQLAIQAVYNHRLNEALNTRENKKAANHTKLFPDGKPRLLTDDEFIAQVTAAKEARQEKLNEKAVGAASRITKKAEKEAADAAWKLIMAEHNQVVAQWEANNLVLRAQKVKVKDLPKKPKRPVKPKPTTTHGLHTSISLSYPRHFHANPYCIKKPFKENQDQLIEHIRTCSSGDLNAVGMMAV